MSESQVTQLCIEGMRAEADGRSDEARELYAQAWMLASDDYEACIAAHYLARQQPTPADALRWNAEALLRAEAVGDERVAPFFPSLLLNLGHSYEQAGDCDRARDLYARALAHLDLDPNPPIHLRESLYTALFRTRERDQG